MTRLYAILGAIGALLASIAGAFALGGRSAKNARDAKDARAEANQRRPAMRFLICLTMLSLTACASGPVANETALCASTAQTRTALAGALVDDGGSESRRAGLAIIAQLDAACE